MQKIRLESLEIQNFTVLSCSWTREGHGWGRRGNYLTPLVSVDPQSLWIPWVSVDPLDLCGSPLASVDTPRKVPASGGLHTWKVAQQPGQQGQLRDPGTSQLSRCPHVTSGPLPHPRHRLSPRKGSSFSWGGAKSPTSSHPAFIPSCCQRPPVGRGYFSLGAKHPQSGHRAKGKKLPAGV